MQEIASYKYNGRNNMNLQGSSSTNGTSKRISVGASNNKEHGDGFQHGERHHLLNLSDSEMNDSLEDLRLPLPPVSGPNQGGILSQGKVLKSSAGAITNGVTTAAGRIRRKIRLKR